MFGNINKINFLSVFYFNFLQSIVLFYLKKNMQCHLHHVLNFF